MKRILIAIPTVIDLVNYQCLQSIYKIKIPEDYSIDIEYFLGYGTALARNKAACMAIDQFYDYILYIDSDQIVPEDALEKLLKCNKDISAGWSIPSTTLTDRSNIFNYDKDNGRYNVIKLKDFPSGIIEVDAVGFACVLIRTEIFKALNYPYFNFIEYPDRSFWAEDYLFCYNAKQLNYSILCDTSLRVGHLKSITI